MADSDADKRAAERYFVDAPIEGRVGEQPFVGRLHDISSTGAAITGVADVVFENDQFVQLHMAGMGQQCGYVRRRIPDGFALQFDANQDDEKREREVAEMLRVLGPRGLQG
ncbi:PilZ domain-containing protein [Thalassospiraceae bacterium LMO-JJ14]|nr:PilZ domain-containing protein [Thalassospiraceae bacterium LMO-JJ14]